MPVASPSAYIAGGTESVPVPHSRRVTYNSQENSLFFSSLSFSQTVYLWSLATVPQIRGPFILSGSRRAFHLENPCTICFISTGPHDLFAASRTGFKGELSCGWEVFFYRT